VSNSEWNLNEEQQAAVIKEAFSIPEAAKSAGVSRDTLYREINSGRLRSAKIGKRRIILRTSLLGWLEQCEARTGL